MVHRPPGRSNGDAVEVAADLAERLKVQKVIGISGSQPLQIYGEAAEHPWRLSGQLHSDVHSLHRSLALGTEDARQIR